MKHLLSARYSISRITICLCLTSCSFAPRYERPPMPINDHYKEAITWIMVKPTLESAKKNCIWWKVFADPTLNELEQKLTLGNPSLGLAYARFQEAKAIVQAARSQLYPTILGNAGESRQKNSSNIANNFNQRLFTYNTLTFQAYLSYEIDAWGQVRNTIAAAAHAARASQFDLAAIDLSLHAELASIYFQLRGDDAAQIALDGIVKADRRALYLVHQLHKEGALSALEEDQAVSRLEISKANAINIRLERAKLEHAIAVLVGEVPANFHLAASTKTIKFIALSPGLPSILLEQRPDIAAAVQRIKTANATIGVAKSAFFPNFTISSLLGLQTKSISDLLSRPSLIWAIGPPSGLTLSPPEISQVIFDGYYLQANLKRARASYYETVNSYQQIVLQAFREVEDGLVATYRLNQENQRQAAATAAAKRALYQANQRMIEGMDTYLNVVDIQDNELNTELKLIDIQTQRQLASVYLIKALGGGWKIAQSIKAPL